MKPWLGIASDGVAHTSKSMYALQQDETLVRDCKTQCLLRQAG